MKGGRGRSRRDPCAGEATHVTMAQVIWAEPALNDLDAIADYIALDNPTAASELVQRVFRHVDQLIFIRIAAPNLANYAVAATVK